MINILKNESLIDSAALYQLLDDIISQKLLVFGLKKNDNFLWYFPHKKTIRQGFHYSLLKGGQGTFTWGVCLDFVPTISGSTLNFIKSENKFKFHLFEWTDEYSSSFFGEQIKDGVTSHWGLNNARNSISELFDRYEPKIKTWLDTASTLENIIEIAEYQVNLGKQYNLHSPNPKYVLAFLYAKSKQQANAIKTFDELNLSDFNNKEEIRIKARLKLLSLVLDTKK